MARTLQACRKSTAETTPPPSDAGQKRPLEKSTEDESKKAQPPTKKSKTDNGEKVGETSQKDGLVTDGDKKPGSNLGANGAQSAKSSNSKMDSSLPKQVEGFTKTSRPASLLIDGQSQRYTPLDVKDGDKSLSSGERTPLVKSRLEGMASSSTNLEVSPVVSDLDAATSKSSRGSRYDHQIRVGVYRTGMLGEERLRVPVLAHVTRSRDSPALIFTLQQKEADKSEVENLRAKKPKFNEITFDVKYQLGSEKATKAEIKGELLDARRLSEVNGDEATSIPMDLDHDESTIMVQPITEAPATSSKTREVAEKVAKSLADSGVTPQQANNNQSMGLAISRQDQHNNIVLDAASSGRTTNQIADKVARQDFNNSIRQAFDQFKLGSDQALAVLKDTTLEAILGQLDVIKALKEQVADTSGIQKLEKQIHELEKSNRNQQTTIRSQSEQIGGQTTEIERQNTIIKDLEAQLAVAREFVLMSTPSTYKLDGEVYTKIPAGKSNAGLYVAVESKTKQIGANFYSDTAVLSRYQLPDMEGELGDIVRMEDNLEFKLISGGPIDGRWVQIPGEQSMLQANGDGLVRTIIRKKLGDSF